MPSEPPVVGFLRIKVDKLRCEAGKNVSGWVYLSLSQTVTSSGPVAIDLVGLSHVGWPTSDPNDPYSQDPSQPPPQPVSAEVEFWRQRIDIAPPQELKEGEHAYEFAFPLPGGLQQPFFHTDPFTGETIGLRYILETTVQPAHDAQDRFKIQPAISQSLEIVSPVVGLDAVSPMHAAQTTNRVAVKLHCRRDRWIPGESATVFASCDNLHPSRPVRLLAVEVLQRTGLWTYAQVSDPNSPSGYTQTPIARDYTRVVARFDLPAIPPQGSHKSSCRVVLPEGLPPTISARGMDIMYEVSVVAVVGGDVNGASVNMGGVKSGGGTEIRCNSEVFILAPGVKLPLPSPDWDEVDEEALVTAQVVEAAVAQVKKMAIETQAEYESRVQEAQRLAMLALEEAERKVKEKADEADLKIQEKSHEADLKVREKEEEAASFVRAKEEEAALLIRAKEDEAASRIKANEEETARVLREKELERLSAEERLKRNEEENQRKLKAAEEATAAAQAAVLAAKKANLAAFSSHPVLPTTSNTMSGKILQSTGLVSTKAVEIQGFGSVYKDSAFYQLFKLFYYNATGDMIESFKAKGECPVVVVFASAHAAVRISRNAVPTMTNADIKDTSRSQSGNQVEHVLPLPLSPGRYYIAVYGTANPLTLTNFTISLRKLPTTLPNSNLLFRTVPAGGSIPADAEPVGKESDGQALYAIRARLADGSVRLGHVGWNSKPVVIGADGKPFAIPKGMAYEVLIKAPGQTRWVSQLEGMPYMAVKVGCEADGRPLCMARVAVTGKTVNLLHKSTVVGECGNHFKGGRAVAKGGLGILVAALEVQTGLIPFEVLVYTNNVAPGVN
ncbi:hypothetical protein HK101_008732 [Irineochytrium annulatum]|nr:hypothetical protein HK101_008732 [Irineochytrium annulatum]